MRRVVEYQRMTKKESQIRSAQDERERSLSHHDMCCCCGMKALSTKKKKGWPCAKGGEKGGDFFWAMEIQPKSSTQNCRVRLCLGIDTYVITHLAQIVA